MAEGTSQSPITNFYKNKNFFITGATGFVGVCLIEKILRSLPECGKLYLLMRPKKKKTIEERLDELRQNSAFEKFDEAALPEAFKKLVPIQGDVGENNLGISEKDRQTLIDNVNIVIHSAATLDFFETLKTTTTINLLGTRRVMQLCSQIKNLDAMVHVSSAYVNSFLNETEEILYDAPGDPDLVIEKVTTLQDVVLKELEPKILKEHPNTYTFTKHLAEHEVNKYAKQFPCSIVRPSMITAAWKEPVPGWTISKNGPQGFFLGASKGVVRRLPLNPDLIMDYIPVDVVVNELLIAGYHTYSINKQNADKELAIFHCTTSTYRPFRFASVIDQVNGYLHLYPLKGAVWYPHLKFASTLTLFRLAAIIFHFIPGFFFDLLIRVTGGRPILIKLHRNVWNSLNILERFIFSEWKFDNKKTLKLAKSLHPEDKKKFFIDIGELRWDSYFLNMLLGVRKNLNKEPIENLEAARRKDKILLVLHILFQLGFYWVVWSLIQSIFGITGAKAALIIPIIYTLLSML